MSTNQVGRLVVATGLMLLVFPAPIAAEEFPFSDATKATISALEEFHFSKRKLTDDLRAEWDDWFIASLDPRKMYFLDSDIREFHERTARKLDDVREGEWSFARFVHSRLNERLTTCQATIDKLLEAKHDYTADESVTLDFDEYAMNAQQLEDRWRKRIKFELMLEKSNGSNRKDAREFLRSRYSRIRQQWNESMPEQLCQIYLNSLTTVFDKDSVYFSEEVFNDIAFSHRWGGPRHSFFLPLRERRGEFIIDRLNPRPWRMDERKELIGWSILAIRRANGEIYHLIERPDWQVFRMIESESGPLGEDMDVKLELYHPLTHQRMSKAWRREIMPWP